MKILFIQNSMKSGGVSRVNGILADQLMLIGHDVEFLSYKEIVDTKYKVSTFNFKKFKIKELVIVFFKLYFFFKKNSFDLVITSSDLESFPVCLLNSFFKNKLIVNSHTNIIEHLKGASLFEVILYKLCGFSYRYSNVVSNVSKGAVQASECFFKINRIVELPNPVTEWKDQTNELGVTHEWFNKYRVIVACGRFIKSKNYDLMLEAFSKIVCEYDDVRLIILGNGPLKTNIENIIKEKGLSSYVSLEGNVCEPRYYMSNSEFLLHTSAYEGSPMVVLEALSVGIPVVSTDFNSGAREILGNNKYGVISKSYSVFDIYLAIKETLEENNRKPKDFYKSRAREYSPEICVNKYLLSVDMS